MSICLTLALCLGLLPVTALAADDPVYLALGDSITTGYAPLDEGEEESQTVGDPFANQVAEKLRYELVNKAANGETSTSLLGRLQSGSNDYIDVSGADLITITIGDNDLMDALYQHLVDCYNEGKEDGQTITPEKLKEALVAP